MRSHTIHAIAWRLAARGGRCAGAMRAAEAGAPVLLNSNEAIMDTLFIPLIIPLALAAGVLLAVQAGANAQLSRAIGAPFAATTLTLSVGAVRLTRHTQL